MGKKVKRKSWEGCRATTESPGAPTWTYFAEVEGSDDRWYCPPHAEAIEAVIASGDWPESMPHEPA